VRGGGSKTATPCGQQNKTLCVRCASAVRIPFRLAHHHMPEKERNIMEKIKLKVRNFVVDNFLFGQADDLQDDTSFLEAGILDSTGVLEVVAFLEQQFGVRVDDDALTPENLDSISSIGAFVSRKLQV
jgi:acyl carrier protein